MAGKSTVEQFQSFLSFPMVFLAFVQGDMVAKIERE